jgi:pimeloyl-ACP methyl ester carboxylesterase
VTRPPNGRLVAIAGGWGEGPRCFGRLGPVLTDAGYQVLCLRSHRWARSPRRPSVYPAAQVRLADGVSRQLAGIEGGIIGVAHSMAGVYMTLAALHHPEQFEAIVLVAPSGLLEQDTIWGLMQRLSRKSALSVVAAVKDRSLRRATWWSLREGLLYSLANPWRAWQEAKALPACPTLGWIAALRARGVKVYAVVATDDAIFPLAQIDRAKDQLDGWIELEGSHDLWFYPERLAQAILSLINAAAPAPGEVAH